MLFFFNAIPLVAGGTFLIPASVYSLVFAKLKYVFAGTAIDEMLDLEFHSFDGTVTRDILKTNSNQRRNHHYDLGDLGYSAFVFDGKEILDCRVLDFSMDGIGLEIPLSKTIPAAGSLLFRDVTYGYKIKSEIEGTEFRRLGLQLFEKSVMSDVAHPSGIRYRRLTGLSSHSFLGFCTLVFLFLLVLFLINETTSSDGLFVRSSTVKRGTTKPNSTSGDVWGLIVGRSKPDERAGDSSNKNSTVASSIKWTVASLGNLLWYGREQLREIFSFVISTEPASTGSTEKANIDRLSRLADMVNDVKQNLNPERLERVLTTTKRELSSESRDRDSQEVGQSTVVETDTKGNGAVVNDQPSSE